MNTTAQASAQRPAQSPQSSPSPFWHYISTRYPLGMHAFYSLVWYIAISGAHAAAHGISKDWRFGWLDAFGAIAATVLFFFMRTVDEIKDLDYDRLYKPDRALVQGLVTPAQMWRYALIAGALLLVTNALISWKLALAVLLIMSFSVFLLWFERVVPAFEKTTMYISTTVSVQLKSGAVAWVFLLNEIAHGGEFNAMNGWLIAAFVCAYMHWEMGRKIALPQFIRPGEKSYATGPGVIGSGLIALALLGFSAAAVYQLVDVRLPENHFYGLEWLPVAGLILSAIGIVLTLLSPKKRFPLGAITQVSYVLCFLFGVIVLTQRSGNGALIALSAPLLFLLNGRVITGILAGASWVQLKIFKGFVNGTALLARSPLHSVSRNVMRLLAALQVVASKGKKQDTLPAVAQEWQRMFPIPPSQMPVTKVTEDTVYMEIRERCPLRDTGDVGACDRLMEFDRHVLAKLGAQLVVLRSQAQAEGVTICQIALRSPNADVSDLKSIYSKQ